MMSLLPERAAKRHLQWLVVVLAVSNVVIGIFSMAALNRADARYSDLIDRSVPVLNDLQTLTAKASQAMGITNPINATRDPATYAATAAVSIGADSTFRNQVLGEKWLTVNIPERLEVQTLGLEFTSTAKRVVDLLQTGNTQEASTVRENQLRPLFFRYLDAVTRAADVLESESQRANASESRRTSQAGRLVLGLASWPVLIVVLILLATALFVSVLTILFRPRVRR